MASAIFNALVDVNEPSKPDPSFHVLRRDKDNIVQKEPSTNQQPWSNFEGAPRSFIETASPSNIELDKMPIGVNVQYNGPQISSPPAVHSSRQRNSGETEREIQPAIQTPNELEISRPSSPSSAGVAEMVPTMWNPRMNMWRVLSAGLMFLGQGMNDSAPGALLPYMEKYYNIGYAIVSLIFIANAAGFILAAFFVHAIDSKIGRAKTIMVTDLVQVAAFAALAATPPFPVLVVAFFITGWAMATVLALNNVFAANMANSTIILGCLHGTYGIGGVVAPIIATSMVNQGILFSRFYLILVGIRAISFFFGGWAFWRFENDSKISETPLTTTENLAGQSHQAHASAPEATKEMSKIQELKQALRNRTTLIGALFIFAYQGAEVAISGWVISFLINYRGSDPAKVGYVTAGFWGGITVGRFMLSWVAYRLGEKALTYGLVAAALGLQLLVWFVPNVIGDSVAIALIGLVLGPVYPCAAAVFTRLLPRKLQNTALAFTSSAGSSGGAVAPFLTGLLAQAAGTWVLHPICISMFVLMELCWFFLPKLHKRKD